MTLIENSIVKQLPSMSSALQTLSGFYYHLDITCEKVLSLVDITDDIPTIAEAMKELKYENMFNQGVRRVQDMLKENGLPRKLPGK